MTFAEKLRELRTAANISEKKLADATGIPFGTIHDYAMRPSRPSFDVVVKIAKALGVTCEAFADCSDLVEKVQEEPTISQAKKRTTKKLTAASRGKPARRKP
jgi:transcriptional regulator with XRE-family HTH domain